MTSNPKIKVCGMNRNTAEVDALAADYLGFIFWEPSKRAFQGKMPVLAPNTKKIGVFVDASVEEVLQKTTEFDLDGLQLHGSESPEYCASLRQELPQPKKVDSDVRLSAVEAPTIIKAFAVGNTFDFSILKAFEAYTDYFLFDTKGKLPGGNGAAFDWTLLRDYPSTTPFFLSGGIGPENLTNVQEFLGSPAAAHCHALDLNSKFEIAPGLKDTQALEAFITTIRTPNMQTYHADENGYYGEFGGAYIPEMLYPNVAELKAKYLEIMAEPSFQEEFQQLLKDYVGRPSPLYFAKRLSERYNTKIYLKREDLNHTGAHKVNNTIGQILMAKRLGKKRIIAETGAGQHGVATATVCALMGMECIVYMGEIDIARQAPNVARMKMLGATVVPALSGSRTLKDATNEAIRDWINNPVDTHYIIGSVVGPHPYPDMVARFQAIISEEIEWQLQEKEGRKNPDYVIACVGGGSNAAGAFYQYLDRPEVGIIAVEAAGKGVDSGESAATSALGKVGIIHGSKTLLMQTPDGQITEPYSISAGLDYPGVGPMHAHLFQSGRGEFISITDADAMKAGLELCELEGIIPAIESSHAFAVLEKKQFNPDDVVVINLSGRGDKDLNTYIDYFKL
jgi:phosphoribosylanthranilate isomerase